MKNNILFAPQTAPEPVTKPAPTQEPGTAPTQQPSRENDPWKVPAPLVDPTPKA